MTRYFAAVVTTVMIMFCCVAIGTNAVFSFPCRVDIYLGTVLYIPITWSHLHSQLEFISPIPVCSTVILGNGNSWKKSGYGLCLYSVVKFHCCQNLNIMFLCHDFFFWTCLYIFLGRAIILCIGLYPKKTDGRRTGGD